MGVDLLDMLPGRYWRPGDMIQIRYGYLAERIHHGFRAEVLRRDEHTGRFTATVVDAETWDELAAQLRAEFVPPPGRQLGPDEVPL